jgi:hypothetical protein
MAYRLRTVLGVPPAERAQGRSVPLARPSGLLARHRVKEAEKLRDPVRADLVA